MMKNSVHAKRHAVFGLLLIFCVIWIITWYYKQQRVTSFSQWNSNKLRQEISQTNVQSATKSFNLSNLEKHLDEELQVASHVKFNIVIWEPAFGAKARFSENPQNCGLCDISYNKSLVNSTNTKAVIFHFNELDGNNMPKFRRPDQYYVWWTMESPSTLLSRKSEMEKFDDVFNITMSYRRDSDVVTPYGTLTNTLVGLKLKNNLDIDDLIKKKKLALWLVSNCHYTNGAVIRMDFVRELIKAGWKLI